MSDIDDIDNTTLFKAFVQGSMACLTFNPPSEQLVKAENKGVGARYCHFFD